jgi:MoxR-like ATPase
MMYENNLFDPRTKVSSDGSIYVYDDNIVLAVNLALAVRRPLLVRGPSGCGKSTLARSVSGILGAAYYEHVVTSRTRARDLLWRVDLLRRFHDAQIPTGDISSLEKYVEPGILWWAIDPESARRRGSSSRRPGLPATDPSAPIPRSGKKASRARERPARAVVLIDEIDKADPDVPNDLLHVFETMQFVVEETGFVVRGDGLPLVLVTSNDERELPLAFTRRCLELTMVMPDEARLLQIGRAHFPHVKEDLLRTLARIVIERAHYSHSAGMPPPSTAEYLDAIIACHALGISPGSHEFEVVVASTALKPRRGLEDF